MSLPNDVFEKITAAILEHFPPNEKLQQWIDWSEGINENDRPFIEAISRVASCSPMPSDIAAYFQIAGWFARRSDWTDMTVADLLVVCLTRDGQLWIGESCALRGVPNELVPEVTKWIRDILHAAEDSYPNLPDNPL